RAKGDGPGDVHAFVAGGDDDDGEQLVPLDRRELLERTENLFRHRSAAHDVLGIVDAADAHGFALIIRTHEADLHDPVDVNILTRVIRILDALGLDPGALRLPLDLD